MPRHAADPSAAILLAPPGQEPPKARGGPRPRGRWYWDTLLEGRLMVASPRGLPALQQLIIEAAAKLSAEPRRRVWTLCADHAYTLLALLALGVGDEATFYHYDLYRVRQARELAREYAVQGFEALCAPDVPREAATAPQLIVATIYKDDEAGLTCELLRQATDALAPGGKLLAATNNPQDQWLGRQLEKTFGNLSIAAKSKIGRVYLVKKSPAHEAGADAGEKAAVADRFIKHLTIGFGDLEMPFDTCYGTFSSDGLDEGSRALLEMMTPPEPCRAILDLGCGWGAMGLIAARLTRAERLVMIDANARAVEMAQRNAEQNALAPTHAEVRLEADAESLSLQDELGSYDLVIGNPPYGTEFRVAERFIQVARFALRLGGRVYFVAKNNERLSLRMEEVFGNHEVLRRRGYSIVSAVRRN